MKFQFKRTEEMINLKMSYFEVEIIKYPYIIDYVIIDIVLFNLMDIYSKMATIIPNNT